MTGESYRVARPYMPTFEVPAAPATLRTLMVLKGCAAPPVDAPMRYLDLGCGEGYGVVLHAAANPHHSYVGVDFAPRHVLRARALARAAGVENATFIEASFGDLAADPTALGAFDIIVCHGVYAWVDADVRAEIDTLIARCLATGGLAYLGYNAMPGWGAPGLLRWLIQRLARGRSGLAREDAIGEAAEFLGLLEEESAGLMRSNPAISRWIERIRTKSPGYLAHEFLPESGGALWHDDVAEAMGALRLDFLGSARLVQNFDAFNFPETVVARLAAADEAGLGETLRDFACNQTFRADVFARGLLPLTAPEAEAALDALEVALAIPRDRPAEVATARGTIEFPEAVVNPMRERLAAGPTSIGDLADRCAAVGVDRDQARQTAAVLVAGGALRPVATTHPTDAAVEACRRFNRAALDHGAITIPGLASPVLGSGLKANADELAAFRGGGPEGIDIAHIHALVPRF